MTDALLPKNFDIIIHAIKKLCTKSTGTPQVYLIPSLALKLGHSLRKCAQIIRGKALREGDLTIDREMKGFLDIMEFEWKNRVSSAALKTMVDRKMDCAHLLPVTEDIMKLNDFLDSLIEIYTNNLIDQVDISRSWQKLTSAVLARIIIFNKRRSGEVARMTLTQYVCRPDWKDQSTTELKASLNDLERTLADRLAVVEVQGKSRKNLKVPVFLTPELKESIDLLIEKRDSSNISRNNIREN
ncbi:hypothetical protein JTB14_035245 [Gonioctena quinquepunctata]|nr:hypothetical protein JTB14_035245 [Gonioctena quinquepunctata]